MGYRINYDTVKIKHEKKTNKKFPVLLACTLGLIVGLHLSGAAEQIRTVLLPGDPDVTKYAITELVESLGEGESFSDAFTAFCQTIVSDGESYE